VKASILSLKVKLSYKSSHKLDVVVDEYKYKLEIEQILLQKAFFHSYVG